MKIRCSIFGFTAIIAVLIALVLWHGKKKPVETPLVASIQTNVTLPTATAPSSTSTVSVHTNAPPAQIATSASTQTTVERIREGLATFNDIPIVFYGRLEDQFGNPVVGAEIAGNTIIYNGARSGAEHISVISDANGFFQINAGRGESLGIMPKKEGYALASTGTEFKFSHMYQNYYVPDSNNPTVIKMWKLQGAEPLVSLDKTYKLHYTDAPINFDLVAGKIVPAGGDVKITVNRPAGNVSEHNPQKWTIDFEVVGGGFIETSDKEWGVTYAAPESGYRPNGTFANNNGPDLINKALFIKSRSDQIYSKLAIEFRINDTPDGFMYITFTGVANTNGSRNWEATTTQ